MDNDTPPPARGSPLIKVVAAGTAGAIMTFLILITNGWILWLFLGTFLVGGLGLLHYWTWGRSMMLQTEAEREKAQRKADQERKW